MKIIKDLFKDHLYGNSLWLMLNSIILTGFGFFFWTINTRLFTPEQIGLASTLISSVGLITSIALLGFNIALIRYLPRFKKKNDMITSCFTISGITALVISLIFVFYLNFFSPKLSFLKENNYYWILFIIFVIFYLFYELIESIFIAYRKAKFVPIKNSIFSILKLVFPFVLVSMGAFGIFSSWMISAAIAFILSLFFISIKYKFFIDKKIIKNMFKFSFGNYLAGFFKTSPQLILPIMITNLINPETTAYFYIAFMIAGLLFTVPSAVSYPLLVEGSLNGKDFKKHVKKSLKFTFVLLAIGIILIMATTKYLLLLFGEAYSENAFKLLQILALSSIPFALNIIYLTVKNVQKKIKTVVLINIIIAASVLILSYLFLNHGLIGIGMAWLISESAIALFVIYELLKDQYKNGKK